MDWSFVHSELTLAMRGADNGGATAARSGTSVAKDVTR